MALLGFVILVVLNTVLGTRMMVHTLDLHQVALLVTTVNVMFAEQQTLL
jgi:hypothetical protein